MRFTRTEKARYPNADAVANVRIARIVNRFEIGAEKFEEMLIEFARYDIFVEFLPDGGGRFVINFNYAVNRSENIFLKNVFYLHTNYK